MVQRHYWHVVQLQEVLVVVRLPISQLQQRHSLNTVILTEPYPSNPLPLPHTHVHNSMSEQPLSRATS
jgi:hypothetical protein